MATGETRTATALTREIASILEGVRLERGMSQADFGKLVSTSQGQARRFLNGEKGMTIREFELICAGLGLRPSTIIRQAEQALARAATTDAESAYAAAVRAELEQWDLAASAKDPDPYADLEEEPQDTP